ncbi:MAG: hypothetical protein RJS98_06885 [Rhodospirillaceae bacterium]
MAVKRNPLKLNALQLKTLTLLQALTEPEEGATAEGQRTIPMLPSPHGNHFHVGPHLVMASDATGLHNPAVWTALNRKGLVAGNPPGAVLTSEGVAYETGLAQKILHSHDH